MRKACESLKFKAKRKRQKNPPTQKDLCCSFLVAKIPIILFFMSDCT